MKENWMEDLRDRLAEFEIDAPAGLWEELQKPRHVWRRRLTAAAAAVLLLLVGGGIYFLIPGTPDMTTAEHTAAVIDAPAPSPSPLGRGRVNICRGRRIARGGCRGWPDA